MGVRVSSGIRLLGAFSSVLRKTIFWIHLVCGVATGLVILMMSGTGVILTYERQILAWSDRAVLARAAAAHERQRLPLDALVAASPPGFAPTTITIAADRRVPVTLSAGRSGTLLLDPRTGQALGASNDTLRHFFDSVTGWHRWFNADGTDRARWRAITGASNLAFLCLILSGIYLWLPRVLKWAALRANLLFSPKARSGKARDFNWHHVFGIWSAAPLALVVATAVVFSYPWANDLVYYTFGDVPPGRAAQPTRADAPSTAEAGAEEWRTAGPLSLEALLAIATTHVEDWRSATLQLPGTGEPRVRFTLDRGNGGQPQHRASLTLDAVTGEVTAFEPFAAQSAGRRARSWVRFLHTGEALGLLGQTVAGLVSLTSLVMVWTGLALAYRRLVAPLFARKPAR